MKDTNINTAPLVSVVMPFFNRVDLTCRAIGSVFAQTYPNLELIVVNDGSPEDDAMVTELLSASRNATYIKLPENIGPGEARNIGIRSANGTYVAFLDSDDTWEIEKLQIQIDEMRKNGWAFSHSSYFRHDTRNGQVKIVHSGSRNYIFPIPAFHCRIATPAVVLERSLLADSSFRSDLRFAEDTFLWLSLSRRVKLHGIDKPLVNVFTGTLTTALNNSIQAEALRLLAKEGLASHPVLLAVHAVYRVARKIQRKISPAFR